jgi:ComF family protein
VDAILPPQCLLTNERVQAHGDLSPHAWQMLQFIDRPYCQKCGVPFETSSLKPPICGPCTAPDGFAGALTASDGLDRVRAALVYDDHSAKLALSLKYADRLDGAAALARMMQRAAADITAPDSLLVPVPLHPSRLRARRYNQAAILAQHLATLTQCDLALTALLRHRATPQQQGLSAKGRERNVRGAFRINKESQPSLKGRRVLLVDDVLTTGSTLKACAKVLKRAGAAEVNGLVLARVVQDGKMTI